MQIPLEIWFQERAVYCMKRCLTLFLAIVLLLSLLPAGTVSIVANAASSEEDFTYEVHNDQVTITGCVSEYFSYIDIPQFIDGYPVVRIGKSAFQDYNYLLELTIPEGVEVIEPYAFYQCKNLRYMTLPDSLVTIEEKAFCGCRYLEELDLGSNLKTIGENAFSYCNALPFYLDLPDGLETIGMGAFSHCASLETVFLPPSLKDLGSKAFYLSSKLSYIVIPETVEHIGEQVLYGTAYYNNSYFWYGDALYVGLLLMDAKATISGSYTIPKGIVHIADGAFTNCDKLKEVVLWDGMEIVGSGAFKGCSNLTSVSMPDSLRSIGSSAFEDCQKLNSISLPSGVTDIGDRAFYGCKAATVLQFPDSVVNLGQDAFTNTGYYNNAENWENNALCLGNFLIKCKSSISGVYEVPKGISTISNDAMKGLSKMTGVVLPDTLTVIGREAFADCTALKEVAFPNGVTSIGERAFFNCSALQTLELGANVSQIGSSAFGACTMLETIRVDSGNQTYRDQGNCLIHTEDHALVMGCKASQIPADGSVTSIGAFAFEGCAGLTQITIPDTVLTIGTSAFQNCTALKTVNLGNGVQIVGELAFAHCDALTQVDLGQSVHTIEDRGFAYNHGLTHVDFPASLRQLGEEAFSNGTGLVSITFQEGIVSIGINCFTFCENLTALQLPDSLKELKDGAFYACEKIATLDLGEGLTAIGRAAFSGCEALETLTIPDSVQTIGSSAFVECTSLRQLDLGCVDEIGYSAFESCESLTEVYIPATVVDIGRSVFSYCPAIEQITVSPQNPWYHSSGNCLIRTDEYKLITGCKNSIIPADGSVRILDKYSFAGCRELKSIVVPDAVMSICEYTFYACSGLESMELPFIGGELNYSNYIGFIFGGGPSQNDLYVPSTLKRIVITGGTKADTSAFSKCSGLQEIILPESLSVIGYSAFQRCPKLQRVIIPGTLKQIKGEDILTGSPYATLFLSIGQGSDDMVQRLGLPYQIGGLITFLDEDGQCIDRIWYLHDEQIVPPDVPEKPADGEYIYTIFWDPVPTLCTGNQTIRLRYIAWTEDGDCAHIHTEIRNGMPATCTEDGYSGDINCIDCGAVIKASEVIEATGHSHEAVITPPTCTESGFTTYICHCGDRYNDYYSDPLGHDYAADTCTRCGAIRENLFTDVSADDFYYEPVQWAVERGITSGATKTTFNPDGNCQRAQVVTFLWRAAGSPEPGTAENPFDDVKPTDFFYQPVLWAVENGITTGVDVSHFAPYAECNRASVVTFLWRAMNRPEVYATDCPFTDVESGAWYEIPILWAAENNITNGMNATTFGTDNICNRAQVVTFLYRAYC